MTVPACTGGCPGAVAVAGAVAIALAALADRAIGEPPETVHPVAWLGRPIALVDRDWTHPRLVGTAAALTIPLAAAGAAATVVLLAAATATGVARIAGVPTVATAAVAGPGGGWSAGTGAVAATVAAGLVVFVATSLRMLVDVARTVVAATASDVDAARRQLRALAGRDAATLSPALVRSAAVESAAENLADGLVAPLAGFLLPVAAWTLLAPATPATGAGLAPASATSPAAAAVLVPVPVPVPVPAPVPVVLALALGAAGAAWVKAVNTCDSMLGYHSKPVGWAAARLDDAVAFAPARASALLLAAAAGDPGAVVRARPLARRPASPNSGWPMATLAETLGVALRKPDHYDLAAGPSLPSVADAERGVAIVERAGWLAVGLAIAGLAVASAPVLAPVLRVPVDPAGTVATAATGAGAVLSGGSGGGGVVAWS